MIKLKPVSEMVKFTYAGDREPPVITQLREKTTEALTQDRAQSLKAIEGIIEGMKKQTTIKLSGGREMKDNVASLNNAILNDLQTKLKELFNTN